jgi:uncharacterized Rmd1/YagE family protein
MPVADAEDIQGSIQTVFTLATAERYLLSRMRNHPELPPKSRKFHESWWISRWGKPGKEGEVFVFANGSFVCWGLEEDEAHRFALEVIGRVPGIEVEPLKLPESEELEFVVDPIELGCEYHSQGQCLTHLFLSPARLEQHDFKAI